MSTKELHLGSPNFQNTYMIFSGLLVMYIWGTKDALHECGKRRKSPPWMCIIWSVLVMSRAKAFSSCENRKVCPLGQAQRDDKTFLWFECICWWCVQVCTNNWPMCAKTSTFSFLLLDVIAWNYLLLRLATPSYCAIHNAYIVHTLAECT